MAPMVGVMLRQIFLMTHDMPPMIFLENRRLLRKLNLSPRVPWTLSRRFSFPSWEREL